MTPDTSQELGRKVDEKQDKVKRIIEYEKALPDGDAEHEAVAAQEYAGYQTVLIDQVNQFQDDLASAQLEDAKKSAMLQRILGIILPADNEVRRGGGATETDSALGIDAANLNSITVRMTAELSALRTELVSPAVAPAEGAPEKVKVSGTLSSIVKDKFGIAYDAGLEGTKKHFAYVMALNDALGEPNRDPNTEITEEKEVDMAAIRTEVERMNAEQINQKFEDYLAVPSSAPWVDALRALAEGRRVGGGGGDGGGGEVVGGDSGDEAGDGRGGEGTGEISHYDLENEKVDSGWAMNVSGDPSKGFIKIEINDQTIGSLAVNSEISVVDATHLGILDARSGMIFKYYETMFEAVLDPVTSELVGVKKIANELSPERAMNHWLSPEEAEKKGVIKRRAGTETTLASVLVPDTMRNFTVVDPSKWKMVPNYNLYDSALFRVVEIKQEASEENAVLTDAIRAVANIGFEFLINKNRKQPHQDFKQSPFVLNDNSNPTAILFKAVNKETKEAEDYVAIDNRDIPLGEKSWIATRDYLNKKFQTEVVAQKKKPQSSSAVV